MKLLVLKRSVTVCCLTVKHQMKVQLQFKARPKEKQSIQWGCQRKEAEEHTEEVRGRGRVLCFAQASLIPPHQRPGFHAAGENDIQRSNVAPASPTRTATA